MKYLKFILALMIAALTMTPLILILHSRSGDLIIFCAGSLFPALKEASLNYKTFKGSKVNIILEPSGSLTALRKVTDLRRRCDILAIADYTLITKYMIPKYANFCIIFAGNEMVLAFTNKSKYYGIINDENWIEILCNKDIRFGFSNPNEDPCGYRSLIVLALAEKFYNKSVFDVLISLNSNIRAYFLKNGTVVIKVPFNLRINTNRLIVRSKSIDLLVLLKQGVIDYAILYKSEAIQWKLKFIRLPPKLNLAYFNESNVYGMVKVILMAETAKKKIVKGEPILYGLTIPYTALNRRQAISFIKFLLGGNGRLILEGYGFTVLKKPVIIGYVPKELEEG